MPPCALPETFGPLRTSQPHGIAALPVSADAPGGGAVPRPVKGKARSRPIPVPAQITMRGSCDFFKERDASQLQEIVGATLLVEPGRAADQLKFISEDFFLRFAFHHAPTSDSKTAEWCRALVHDVGSLLENLVSPDKGYPDRQMSLQARIVLTNIGTDTGITERHLRWLGFGEDIWEALDRGPASLRLLKRQADFAAVRYQEQASTGRTGQRRSCSPAWPKWNRCTPWRRKAASRRVMLEVQPSLRPGWQPAPKQCGI
jgi:hypothetical protein